MHLRKAQDPNASASQLEDLPYQQSTPLDPSSSKQDQEVQDLCREILMVCIAEEPEGDPTERLNLDDYYSDDFNEYLSNSTEATPPTITEAQVTIFVFLVPSSSRTVDPYLQTLLLRVSLSRLGGKHRQILRSSHTKVHSFNSNVGYL